MKHLDNINRCILQQMLKAFGLDAIIAALSEIAGMQVFRELTRPDIDVLVNPDGYLVNGHHRRAAMLEEKGDGHTH